MGREREREHLEELCFIKLRGDGIKNLGERKVGGRKRERETEREREREREREAVFGRTCCINQPDDGDREPAGRKVTRDRERLEGILNSSVHAVLRSGPTSVLRRVSSSSSLSLYNSPILLFR